jgi:hypothetical protein
MAASGNAPLEGFHYVKAKRSTGKILVAAEGILSFVRGSPVALS